MADEFCPRQIIFTIPGTPGVVVTATENNGSIDFVVDVENSSGQVADLRGFFFDIAEGKLAGLSATSAGGLLTEVAVSANAVLDLGNGANMNGATKDGFDVGLEWGTQGIGKDDIDTAGFTLTNTAGDLTLDDIAHQRFGARLTSVGDEGGQRNDSEKLIVVAPAAPDANDDSYTIFEDNSAGLDDPSKTPVNFVMTVLDNDTDADGDPIFIKSIHEQPAHGSITIAGDGQSLIYTPELDYAGQVTFEYCIDDGDGGQDHALVTIDITPVADIPIVNYTVAATANVNEVLITVSATQADADSSEYIDSIVSSALPLGSTLSPVTWNPAAQLDNLTHQFLLTVPLNQDTNFNLTFTGTAVETVNGDTETNSVTVPIVYEYNEFDSSLQFSADDQSIWSSGDQFKFTSDEFLGINTGPFDEDTSFGPFSAGISGHFKAGFQSTLLFNGGSIDATADYDITVTTNYNKTVDTLLIDTSSLLTNAAFATLGPSGTYTLDFVWDILLQAYASINIDFGSIDFDPLGIIPGDQTVDVGGIHETLNFPAIDIGPGSVNIIDIDSSDLGGSFDFPPPADAFSVDFAWPNIATSGSSPPLNPVVSSGASNNFLQLNLDIDELVTQLAGLPVNPFNPRLDIAGGLFYAELDILNLFANAGLNFLQQFEMAMGDLVGVLSFEDGSFSAFEIGDSLQIANALAIDVGGDNDGLVEFNFVIAPQSQLSNLTQLGFNVGGGIDLLSGEVGYDASFTFFGETIGFSDSVGFGPLAQFAFSVPVASVDVFDQTFALAFASQQVNAFA